MADVLCIPSHIVDKLQSKLKSGELKLDWENLDKMSNKDRAEYFNKFVNDKTISNFMSTKFKEAWNDATESSLKKWVETFFSKNKTEEKKGIIEKINSFKNEDWSNKKTVDSLYEDLISVELGLNLSKEEVENIFKITDKINDIEENARKNITEKINIPKEEFTIYDAIDNFVVLNDNDFEKYVLEYFKMRSQLDDYIDKLNPASWFTKYLVTWSPLAMLTSIKSPIINIIGNITSGSELFLKNILRKIFQVQGTESNKELIEKYVHRVRQIYSESYYDLSRMRYLNSNRRWAGEKKSASINNKVGKFYSDMVFKYGLGYPDVWFASLHFANYLDIAARLAAKKAGLSGNELNKLSEKIFIEGTKIHPGIIKFNDEIISIAQDLRENAIIEAERGTFTEDSAYSKIALELRKIIDIPAGKIGLEGLSKALVPFAKVPANVIGRTFDAGGMYTVKSLVNLGMALKHLSKKNYEQAGHYMSESGSLAVNQGIVIAIAYLIASTLKFADPDDEDYIGIMPLTAKERQLMREKNAIPNSIKIGEYYISLDYFGIYANPLMSILIFKKYGDNFWKMTNEYTKILSNQIMNIPGVEDIYNIIGAGNELKEIMKEGQFKPEEQAIIGMNTLFNFFYVRTVPAIINDIATSIHINQVKYDKMSYLNKLEVFNPEAEKRLNLFGEPYKGQSYLQIFFGSRVKIGEENKYIKEFERLNSYGMLPAIGDIEYVNKKVRMLKNQIGNDNFNNFIKDFGQEFKERLDNLLDNENYKNKTPKDQKRKIEDIKNKLIKRLLRKYNYSDEIEKAG